MSRSRLDPTFAFDAEVGRVWFCCPPPCLENGYLDNIRWTVEAYDPLTLSPSVHCLKCGTHGWIRGGQWVSAG